MCGIAGYLNLSVQESQQDMESLAEHMASTLVHRGPDDWGMWADAVAGIALSFRRLAIIDLSPAGHQPMHSADNRFVIVYNGEIYNYLDLRRELQQRGHTFRGSSDTEVILAACSEWGLEAALPRLWRMFSIALWDRQAGQLILARDRIGKKPLYYGNLIGALVFGSELKAVRAHPAFHAEIDRDSLALYVRFSFVPEYASIFKGISKLLPGHLGIFRAGRAPIIKSYWQARQAVEDGLAHPLELSEPEAIYELDTLLRDAVARRMVADVPLGALLSGGIDSSTMVALMQAQSARPVKTFSIGFHEDSYNEADAAKRVARHLGTDHTELYVTPTEAQSVIPRLPNLYDEPFADSSQIPTFLVCQLARQSVTVSLSGDGGDELFGGYRVYQLAEDVWARMRCVPRPARLLAAGAIHRVRSEQWDAMYSRIARVAPARLREKMPGDRLYKFARVIGATDADSLHRQIVSIWKTPNALVVDAHDAPRTPPPFTSDLRRPTFTERMMYSDLVSYLPSDILVKVDRASMGVGLEARCPLLDHRVVEFAWRLPLKYKTRHGQTKWILKQVLHQYVPQTLVERPKMGFGIPIDAWLRNPLKE